MSAAAGCAQVTAWTGDWVPRPAATGGCHSLDAYLFRFLRLLLVRWRMVRWASAATVMGRTTESRPSAVGPVSLVGPSRAALLERDDALASLLAALEHCRRGAGGVVVIAGEAGIGKTSLIRAVRGEAGERARVLGAGCEDPVTPRPPRPPRGMFRGAGPPRPAGDAD